MTHPIGGDIVVEQRIEAAPSTVYRYLTEADRWIRWQGVDATLEARVGGLFSIVMGNGMNARGQFVRLVPDRLVVFTWGWVDRPGIPPGSTTVEIELIPEGSGTLLTLTHRSLPDDQAPAHDAGWRQHLPQLAGAAETAEPGT